MTIKAYYPPPKSQPASPAQQDYDQAKPSADSAARARVLGPADPAAHPAVAAFRSALTLPFQVGSPQVLQTSFGALDALSTALGDLRPVPKAQVQIALHAMADKLQASGADTAATMLKATAGNPPAMNNRQMPGAGSTENR